MRRGRCPKCAEGGKRWTVTLPSADVDDDEAQGKDRVPAQLRGRLYAKVKAQAKAERMLVKDWIERAVIHELVRARKQPLAPVSRT